MNNMNEQKRRRFLEPSNSKNKRLNTINEDPGRKRVEEKRLFVNMRWTDKKKRSSKKIMKVEKERRSE